MYDKTKFTVIVPTRERADTLYYCLRTIVRQKYDNLEILVSDNFSQDNTEQVVRSIGDSRIRYINTGRPLDMSRNFEFALSHVKDGWITYLGDDDGLMPNALSVANNVINETGCKALSSNWHHYTWPNFDGVIRPNRLTVKTGRGYQIRDAKVALRQTLKGRLNYLELPGVYIGAFAEYETLNRLRDNSGHFFCSKTPDVYAAVALSSTLGWYVYMNQPLSICGASAHSIGASQFGSSTNLSASARFFSEEGIPFHPAIGNGRVRSIQLIVYEAYLRAAHLHNDFVCTSMAEQLALSIAHSGDARMDVTDYCRGIAESHGIDFQLVKASARRFSLLHRVPTRFRRLKSPFPEFQVDGELLGVMNIFDATVAANALYLQVTLNKAWRVRKLLRALFRRAGLLKPEATKTPTTHFFPG
jgi:hypothetical protein